MGPKWRSVADRCCQGHYQPLLLLYSKENGCPIDTAAALKATVVQKKPDYDQRYQAIHRQCEYSIIRITLTVKLDV